MALTSVHSAFFILTILGVDFIQTKHFLVETEAEDTSGNDYKEDHCNKVLYYYYKSEMKMF